MNYSSVNRRYPGENVANQVSKTSKLINEIRDYCSRSELRSTLEYMWACLSAHVVALVDLIPSTKVRKAISPLYAAVIIVVIIVAGVAAIYFIVISQGPATTQYP